jgi:capsule polysaccharide export protein KpsE/RkpR
MANKEKTLEELRIEAELAKKAYEAAKKLDEQKKKEEAERKKAELALEHDKRKKEVDDAINHAANLIKTYNEDYGTYVMTHKNLASYLLDFLF